MFKKLLCVVLITSLALTTSSCSNAPTSASSRASKTPEYKQVAREEHKPVSIYINGVYTEMENGARFDDEGKTILPVTDLKTIGVEYALNGEKLTLSNDTAKVDVTDLYKVDDVVFIPLKVVIDNFCDDFTWEAETRSAYLSVKLVPVILDAKSFYSKNGATVTEDELIEMNGQPDNIEEWNFLGTTKSYPIRTLVYGIFRYHFNGGVLHRISSDDAIPFSDKKDLLAMFGLNETSKSKITDTGYAFRVSNCGVDDFWIPTIDYENKNFTALRISYSPLFENGSTSITKEREDVKTYPFGFSHQEFKDRFLKIANELDIDFNITSSVSTEGLYISTHKINDFISIALTGPDSETPQVLLLQASGGDGTTLSGGYLIIAISVAISCVDDTIKEPEQRAEIMTALKIYDLDNIPPEGAKFIYNGYEYSFEISEKLGAIFTAQKISE